METDKSARDESQVSLYTETAMKAKLPAVKQKAFKAMSSKIRLCCLG
jgi:hypothetical protein